ncbi:hypothetical protein BKA70DRAFT_1214173 [Coprinopsis sp. MPI-PUGE-AT-0042]|nr:hypothetical protein BKA70DRAFT_1214173 [Coprinopsis sp. MPI-PUGE-AT-0042]
MYLYNFLPDDWSPCLHHSIIFQIRRIGDKLVNMDTSGKRMGTASSVGTLCGPPISIVLLCIYSNNAAPDASATSSPASFEADLSRPKDTSTRKGNKTKYALNLVDQSVRLQLGPLESHSEPGLLLRITPPASASIK